MREMRDSIDRSMQAHELGLPTVPRHGQSSCCRFVRFPQLVDFGPDAIDLPHLAAKTLVVALIGIDCSGVLRTADG